VKGTLDLDLLDKLERKIGKFAVKGLINYIVTANLIVFLVAYSDPDSDLINRLLLVPSLVMEGEVWRLVSYIFIPPAASVLWIFFILYFYFLVGSNLEQEWGSFKFNVYYLLGVIGTSIAGFISGEGTTALYLNLSLFLAFARIFPDFEILLFFVLPVKVKYLAWVNWFFLAFTMLTSPLPIKAAALASVINYFMFFGKDILSSAKSSRQSYQNRQNFQKKVLKDFTIHKCTTCGTTEKDQPHMHFRYCSTCEGDYEYCMDHLKTHEHIKSDKGEKQT
jgi:membrane associated rhomboid family serine protease